MLREDVYQKLALEFGSPIGVAKEITQIDIQKIENVVEKRVSNTEWESNRIIADWVIKGVYERNWRKYWEIRKANPNMSIRMVYKKADKDANRS